MFWNIIAFVAGYEAANWFMSIHERKTLVRVARLLAGGKPLLVVGNPKGRHDAGTLCVDLCPVAPCLEANIEDLSSVPDRFFGAAFVGHVLEHVENPAKAFAEIKRVAGHVVVAYPYANTLIAWFHPDHRWIILSADKEIRFIENPVRRFLTGNTFSPEPPRRALPSTRRT